MRTVQDLPETWHNPLHAGDLMVVERPGAFHAFMSIWFERPDTIPGRPEVWAYTDRISYAPGDTVRVHVSGTTPVVDVTMHLDTESTLELHRGEASVEHHPTPADAYRTGCGWPVAFEWTIPLDCPSGGCILTVSGRGPDATARHQHLFIIGPARGSSDRSERVLMIAATSTWIAYNDWGGANYYYGVEPGFVGGRSPALSTQRPWTRSTVSLPSDHPRMAPKGQGRAGEVFEYAFSNGYSKYFAGSGWASYERPFAHWCERQGYQLDIASQHDLHHRDDLLEGYGTVLIVGHDEYWSSEMRDRIDAFVDHGGRVARFGANFMWQIRFDDDGDTQVCYKYDAFETDPVAATGPAHEVTGAWEDRRIGRPGASTFGVNGFRGVYPHSGAGPGLIVFRPEHWAFRGTGLGYGETIGAAAKVFSFEVDGLEYTFEDGLPVPTGADGAPEGLSILAMNFAALGQRDRGGPRVGLGDREAIAAALFIDGDVEPDTLERRNRGSGVAVHFERGDGEVFCVGAAEWVNGLIEADAAVEQVTRNVLDRFLASG